MPLDLRASPSGPLIDIIDPGLVADGRVVYVAKLTSVPTELQTGSAVQPYSTLSQAVASLDTNTGGVIIAAPGDYSTEAPLVMIGNEWSIINADPHPNYVFGGIGVNNVVLPAITVGGSQSLNLVGCRLTGNVAVGLRLTLDSCWVNAIAINAPALDAADTRFLVGSTIQLFFGAGFVDCELDSGNIANTNPVTVRMFDCLLLTALTMTSPATSTLRVDSRTASAFDGFIPTLTGVNLVYEQVSCGSSRQIISTAAGNMGVVDISALQPGGAFIHQPTGNFNIDGFTAKQNGFWFDYVWDQVVSLSIGTFNYDVGATLTSIRTPQSVAYNTVRNTTLRFRYQFNRWRMEVPGMPFDSVNPLVVDPIINRAVPFVAYRAFTAGGGGGAADDVTIVNLANLTFPVRVLDAWLNVSTAVIGSSCQVRTASGGGGAALTSALASAATGTSRNNDTTTRTAVAADGLFLRRSDSGVAGDISVLLVRTG